MGESLVQSLIKKVVFPGFIIFIEQINTIVQGLRKFAKVTLACWKFPINTLANIYVRISVPHFLRAKSSTFSDVLSGK